jgi:hypothetical protein
MGSGGNSGSSTTSNVIPPELRELYRTSADNIQSLQGDLDLSRAAGDLTMGVAGANGNELRARNHAMNLYNQGAGQSRRAGFMTNNAFGDAEKMRTSGAPGAGLINSNLNHAQQIAGQRVAASADDIANDASLIASQEAFTRTAMPNIAAKMSSMGLGRSSEHGKMILDAWAKNSTPHVQAAVQREQDRVNSMRDTALATADRRLSLSDIVSGRQKSALDAKLGAAGLENQIGNDQFNRQKGAIDTNMAVGGVLRGIEDSRFKAAYDDILRRQALGEKALFAPFGQAGSMIGSRTTNSSGGK